MNPLCFIQNCSLDGENDYAEVLFLFLLFNFLFLVFKRGSHIKQFLDLLLILVLMWRPLGGGCSGVGAQQLLRQAEDVSDNEGLLHPSHHHQPGYGLHLLRRPQEVNILPPYFKPHESKQILQHLHL